MDVTIWPPLRVNSIAGEIVTYRQCLWCEVVINPARAPEMLNETNTLLTMWRRLGQGTLPNRKSFAPFQIPALLPSIFVLDVADKVEDYRFRLAGAELEQAYGGKAVGLTLGQIDVGSQTARRELLRDYETCARERVVTLSRQTFMVETTGPFAHERILLPFETNNPGVTGQIIGGFFFESRYRGLNWKKGLTDWREISNEIFHASKSA
jgi:hypothetical protein